MKKKNIIIAFAMLLLTGVALSTATYAWFTANRQISLGKIDVNVSASNGIQVSTDAVNWKSTLTTAELRNARYTGSTTQFADFANANSFFAPVSTDGTIANGKFEMFLGELQNDGSITLTTETEVQEHCSNTAFTTEATCTEGGGTWTATNPHFIAFDLFIQATEQTQIGLVNTSTVAAVTGGVDRQLKSSARIGFIYNGVAQNAADAYDLQTGNKYSIWEPNAETHTTKMIDLGSAVAGNIYTYSGATSVCTNCVVGNATNFASIPAGGNGSYFRTNSANTYWTDNTTTNNAVMPTTAWNTDDNANYPTLFTVAAGINKVRVYIWFEGQDLDNENTATLGDAVSVVLNLNAKEVTP